MFRDRDNALKAGELFDEPTSGAPPQAPLEPAGRGDPADRTGRELAPRRDLGETVPAVIAPDAGAASDTRRSSGRKPRVPRRVVAAVAALLVAGAGAWYGHQWWTVGRFIVSTDDAYVGANNTTLAAKISGYVSTVGVDNNARVRAGDVIATIDDGDYRLAVDAARNKVATQQATIDRIGRQATAQQATVDQARAQLASSQAGATRAEQELDRQQALANREFASRQRLEQARAERDQAAAAVKSNQAAVEAALANVAVLEAQKEEAARSLKELETALAKAERDFSFAVIRAPFDGVIGNRAVQTADFVQPGQRLASLVPLDAVFVDANFKETQLARLRPGQKVSITVDALPDRSIDATVESVAPASGSTFALLPTDNATGNFTKIVQRVPVRIRVPAAVASEEVMRPGMSVVVRVDTRADPAQVAQVATRRVQ